MEAIPAGLDIGTAEAGGAPGRATSAGATAPQQGEDQGEVEAAAAEWDAGHAVNIRISIPLGFCRFYVTFVAGKERRSSTRRKSERRKHPLSTFGNMVFLFGLGTAGGLALLALIQFLSAFVFQEAGIVVMPS